MTAFQALSDMLPLTRGRYTVMNSVIIKELVTVFQALSDMLPLTRGRYTVMNSVIIKKS